MVFGCGRTSGLRDTNLPLIAQRSLQYAGEHVGLDAQFVFLVAVHGCSIERHVLRRHIKDGDDSFSLSRVEGIEQLNRIGNALGELDTTGLEQQAVAFVKIYCRTQ
jgi:hypothetical protein